MPFQATITGKRGTLLSGNLMARCFLWTVFLTMSFFNASISSALETKELPDELKDIEITDDFLKPTEKRVGTVILVKGHGRLVIVRKASNKGFYADTNDSVYENDIVYTLSDCRCKIKFFDDSEIVMADNSIFEIREMYSSFFKSEKRTLFGMSKGKTIFYIRKAFQYKSRRIQVETPNTTVGVRGTTFGVEVKKLKQGRGQAGILHRMLASANLTYLALGPATGLFETSIYLLTGRVDCTSLVDQATAHLFANQTVVSGPTGLGPVSFNPTAVSAFIGSVSSDMDPGPESDAASSGGGGGGGGGGH